jgi:hypothetical protein
MAATISQIIAPNNPDLTGRQVIAYGTIVLTGNYGGAATHGDTLNLQQLGDLLKSSQLPIQVEIWENPPAGTLPTGYIWTYCQGTTQLNGVLNIMSGVNTEYTQGSAYSAALLAAVLKFSVWAALY